MGAKFKTWMYFPDAKAHGNWLDSLFTLKVRNSICLNWHQISSNKVLRFRRFKHVFVFLIDDLTTIEYLKLTLPVYLVHSKVHEMYTFFDYQKRQNNQPFERRRFNIVTEESSDRDGGPYSVTIMVKSSLYLHAMKI